MTLYVILIFVAILGGMAISVAAFGTGGKRKKIFQDIYFTIEEVDGVAVLYTKTGDYHFQYIKFNPDEPWITKTGESAPEETKALLSLSTIHPEKFIHKVKTDWSTGEILDMDADTTNNLNDKK